MCNMARFMSLVALVSTSEAFLHRPYRNRQIERSNLKAANKEEEQFTLNYDDDDIVVDKRLTRPPINVNKESILFGENPATVADNNTLRLWRGIKRRLPFVLTGARAEDTADDNPIGGIYNMVFVRLPTILAGCVYGKNLLQGHPLVVDIGDGPFEASPLAVAAVLYFILR